MMPATDRPAPPAQHPDKVLTMHDRKLMRHALGLNDPKCRKRSYRNRFSAAQNGEDDDTFRRLEALGFAEMTWRGVTSINYMLTLRGAEEVLEPGESLDPDDFH